MVKIWAFSTYMCFYDSDIPKADKAEARFLDETFPGFNTFVYESFATAHVRSYVFPYRLMIGLAETAFPALIPASDIA